MPDALLIVDVQHGFINAHTRHISERVDRLQHHYDRVFATRFYNSTEFDFFRRLIGWHELAPGSYGHPLSFAVRGDATIIDKCVYGCADQWFLNRLQEEGIETVDVCGIDTDICVTKCAVDLFEQGIVPRVLARYCASTAGIDAHRAALRTLERFIGLDQVIRGEPRSPRRPAPF